MVARRLKVGLIGAIHPFRSGEAQSNTLLCENLSRNHEVTAFSFERLYPKLFFSDKARTHESKKELSFERRFIIDSLDPVSWARTAAEIRRADPDVVMVTWGTMLLAPCYVFLLNAIRMTTRAKICILAHDLHLREEGILNEVLARSVLSRAHYYVASSSKSLEYLKQLYSHARVELLLATTYDTRFDQHRSAPEHARSKLGIAEPNVVLFFGRERPYEGLEYMIRAMPEALKYADIRFLVVGEFWGEREAHEEDAERLGVRDKLTIVDRFVTDDETVDYFDAADVLVLPYVSDAGAAEILFAYGFERPVIVTNVPGLTEWVDHGKTGYMVPPRDAAELAKAIGRFFTMTDRQAFANNLARKRLDFEWGPDKEAIIFHGL